MGFFDNFPYTNFHEINLDWLLQAMKNLDASVREYMAVNKVGFGGIWDITKQYPAYTVVANGSQSYISLKPVPAGVDIENTEYWQLLADLDPRIGPLIEEVSRLTTDINAVNKDIDNLEKYSVKAWGAKGDGVTDDSSAIQAAINGTEYGVVFFPKGDYLMSSPVTLKREVRVCGASKNGVRLLAAKGAFSVYPEFGTTVSDMTILGNGTGNGISINGTGNAPLRVNDIELDNLYIQNYDFGVRASWAWNVKITRCDIYNCGNALKILGSSVNNMVSDCVLNNAGNRYAVVSFEPVGGNAEGWMFNNCFIGYGAESFNITGALAVEISNCILDLNTGNAITVTGAHNMKISNSWVLSDNANAIHFNALAVSDSLQCSITGSHIYSKKGYGIRLDSNGNNCTIIGNTFECKEAPIYIDFCGGHTVVGNTSITPSESIINGAGNFFESNANMTAVFPGHHRNTYNGNCAVVYNYYDAPPNLGSWKIGDKVFYKNPQKTGFIGAVCTEEGSPGTWKNFGALQ